MKNYYALIRFDGSLVNGFLLIGFEDSESARLSVIKELTKTIQKCKEKLKKDKNNYSTEQELWRAKSFRRSFTKPHRKNHKKICNKETVNPVLEMVELPDSFVMQSGFWLSSGVGENAKDYICNVPRDREEHPMGYVVSQLK